MPAQPKAARWVEQVVAAVIAEGQGRSRDQEAVGVLDAQAAEDAALDRSEPFAAVRPGPFLLPGEVALPLDIAGEVDRLGRVSGEILVRSRELQVQRLVALHEIRTANLDPEQLLGCASNSAKRQCAFGVEEIAVGPARLEPDALSRAVTKFARYRVLRRRFQANVEIDRPSAADGHDADVGICDKRRRDQRAAQVVDLRAPEGFAGLEARDQCDMPGAERRPPADADRPETRDGPWIDRQL